MLSVRYEVNLCIKRTLTSISKRLNGKIIWEKAQKARSELASRLNTNEWMKVQVFRCVFLCTTCRYTLPYETQTPHPHYKQPILKTTTSKRMRIESSFIDFSPLWRCGPTRTTASSFLRFLDHTQQRITVGRTPLDEWSARRRDLYLTTHNTHNNRQTSMPPMGFEPTISAGERP